MFTCARCCDCNAPINHEDKRCTLCTMRYWDD
jgi:hypothetical protein